MGPESEALQPAAQENADGSSESRNLKSMTSVATAPYTMISESREDIQRKDLCAKLVVLLRDPATYKQFLSRCDTSAQHLVDLLQDVS